MYSIYKTYVVVKCSLFMESTDNILKFLRFFFLSESIIACALNSKLHILQA